MKISVFAGDIADAPADAICTSTNPRLSLMMGTGASVREKAGWNVMRACEAIVEREAQRLGHRGLRAGSVHPTTAGDMNCKLLIHCVASDQSHMTSAPIIQACVKNALAAAHNAGCRSIAMPLFGTGHARFKFEQAIPVILAALRDAPVQLDEVLLAINDGGKARAAEQLIAAESFSPPVAGRR